MNRFLHCAAVWMFAAAIVSPLRAADAEKGSEKYTLRYRFQPGETVRWEVEHRSNVRATVSGTTQSTETSSVSLKAWRVVDVQPDGAVTFEHRVERVDMRQKLSGRDEVRYNSETDPVPPPGFEDAAKSVGPVLATVTIDPTGKILKRGNAKPAAVPSATGEPSPADGWMTIPLPPEPVPIGHAWSLPADLEIPLEGGMVKKIRAVQQFVLEDVRTGVATIRVSTDILTPITDPAVESQLVQREASGRVRFDIDAGRVLGQQMDVDKRVVGFRGDASSIHYLNRFSERLAPETVRTAGNPANPRSEK